MRRTFAGLTSFCAAQLLLAAAIGAVKIEGPATHKRDSLVELRAVGAPEGGAVLWDVFPEGVTTKKEGGDWLVLNGPPGNYSVRAMVLSIKDGKILVERASHSLKIEGESPLPPAPPPGPPSPPPPAPPTPPAPLPPGSPLAALVQIQFGTAGCTATFVGGLESRYGKRQLALTAAHCIKAVGDTGTAKLKDGRSFRVKVLTFNRTSDVAWLEVDTGGATVPVAYLADGEPEVGTRIWHSGYGVDKPGNREDGTVLARPNSQGQLAYRLSVSPGDSGGGIVVDASGRVLSPVCCTTCLACTGTVYGGSVASVRAAMPPASAASVASSLPPIRPGRATGEPPLVHPILRVVPEDRRPEGAKDVQLFYPVQDLSGLKPASR